MTHIIRDLNAWRELRNNAYANKTIGFVPTMGNLHAGHQSLLERSNKKMKSMCSVFSLTPHNLMIKMI